MRRLIIRHGGIGDCVLAMPAIDQWRKDCEYLEIWVPFPVVPLMRADRVRSMEATGILTLDNGVAQKSVEDSMRGFDSIISWYDIGGFREFSIARGFPVEFLIPVPDPALIHMADYFLQQSGAFGHSVPHFCCHRFQPKNHVIFHPFSGSKVKDWPDWKFRETAGRMSVPVSWTAGPLQPWRGALRFTSLYDLASWITSARAYVGNDSGITHLAAAVGVPTLALFGPTDPKIWGPRGCVRVIRRKSMQDIPVESVVETVEEMIS
jgi:heptosyltransferase III